MSARKIGVEEELMLVDPRTGFLTAVARRAVSSHDHGSHAPQGRADQPAQADPPVEQELFLEQFETQTPPCVTLDDLAVHLRHGRRSLGEAADSAGADAAAAAVPVLVDDGVHVTPDPRYERIGEEYGELARSALACATHVHVDVGGPDEGVRVLDGIAPWLPVLLAISANSPYSHGRDTGHASWRAQVWSRWPSYGTGEPFGDLAAYDEVTARLVRWGAAVDDAMVYLPARLSADYPTVEVRIADVCTDLEDTVLVAALTRALVTTAADAEPERWRSELLRAATWRASRYGLGGRLVDPATRELAPARTAIESLVAHVRPALEEAGDLDLVGALVERVLATGNGAIRQRRRYETSDGSLEAVVADVVQRTRESWAGA